MENILTCPAEPLREASLESIDSNSPGGMGFIENTNKMIQIPGVDEITMKGGVYAFINKADNDKMYVGHGKDIKGRWRGHKKSIKDKKRTAYFVNALRKYNWENFEKIVIEYVDDTKLRKQREIYWIAFHKTKDKNFGYNLTDGGEGREGYVYSQETRKKMSEKMTEWVRVNGNNMTGKHHNEETKQILSEKHKEWYKTHEHPWLGGKHTKESLEIISRTSKERFENPLNCPGFNKPKPLELRKQISETQKTKYKLNGHHSTGLKWTKEYRENYLANKIKKVVQIDPLTHEIIKVWENATEARHALIGNRKDNTICKVLNPKMPNKIAHGYRWKYVEDIPPDSNLIKNQTPQTHGPAN